MEKTAKLIGCKNSWLHERTIGTAVKRKPTVQKNIERSYLADSTSKSQLYGRLRLFLMQALKILRRKCALPTESPLQIVFYNKIRNDPLYFAKQHRNWLQTRVADINEVQRLGNFVSEKKSTLGTLRNYGKCFYELSKARLR